MKRLAAVFTVAVSVLALAACASTDRDQEIRELRAQLEQAKAENAALAQRLAGAERALAGPQTLYEQAAALESQGRGREALELYKLAARSGDGGRAALRLGEIYNRGIPGVSPDYAESLKWYTTARALGQEVVLKKP